MEKLLLVFIFFISHSLFAQEECTIGVASGRATDDGRPLIWKTRDTDELDNEVVYNTNYSISFLEISNAGKTYAWMGVNEDGFAILNSLAADLPIGSSGYSNGGLMRDALGNCSNIDEFQQFLDDNDHAKTRGNFAVLDASSSAALFEISGYDYWKFDLNDTISFPLGYIIRTNFAENGSLPYGSGYQRFDRSSDLVADFHSGDSLNYHSILRYQMRDFSDFDSNPVSVPFADKWNDSRPYGYIYSDVSICRATSVSATVIQGLLPGEAAQLTTMWTILGQPASTVAIPYWPVGETPEYADGSSTALLCDVSIQIRNQLFDYPENSKYLDSYKLLDGNGGGIWKAIFPVEDSVLSLSEFWLDKWRTTGMVESEMLALQEQNTEYVHGELQQIYQDMVTSIPEVAEDLLPDGFVLNQNYPNPFNSATVFSFSLPSAASVFIEVYDIQGRLKSIVPTKSYSVGDHTVQFDARELNIQSSGIYFYRMEASTASGKTRHTRKMSYIK